MNDPIVISGYGISISITPAALNALTVDGCENIVKLFQKAANDITAGKQHPTNADLVNFKRTATT